MSKPPLIYNLFPRYFDCIDSWQDVLPHVAGMGFNHVFVNPFHATGSSGSLYAVKDYFKINETFLKYGQDPSDWSPLKMFVRKCREMDIRVVMDLVINHTAIDSPLTDLYPSWYKRDVNGNIINPCAVDPLDSSNVTVWGDLARIDYEKTPDRQGLLEYFDNVIKFFQGMGITGFRCDAAYQVPADIWESMISAAKKRCSDTCFFAETLGCSPDQITALKGTGFDYLFNSSKWWNFDQNWCLQQHEENRKVAPSISFPESHDTDRLARESSGSIDVQKNRYVLASVFSEGLLMPMGFEYGKRTKMDVVKGVPKDYAEEPLWDISCWISEVNCLKLSLPVMCEEGRWQPLCGYDEDIFVMEKNTEGGVPSIFLAVNKTEDRREVSMAGYGRKISAFIRMCGDNVLEQQDVIKPLLLRPREILILV